MIQKPFKANPFPVGSVEPSPFITASWKQHAELITHLCQFSQNVLLLVGPPEAGKTTFLRYCYQLSTPYLSKIVITAKAEQSAPALMQEIVEAFKQEWQGIPRGLQQIRACVEEAAARQVSYGLFIDNAHLLNNEQLKMLLHLVHFEAEPRKQLHLVLLAEPSLELRLFSPEFALDLQGKLYTVELETWTLPDLKAYLAQDLAGNLNEDQIAFIFERSRGLPGYVMREKQQLLQKNIDRGFTTMTNNSGIKRWGKHPISLGILAGVIFGSAYFLSNALPEEEGSTTIPLNTAQLEKTAPEAQSEVGAPSVQEASDLEAPNSETPAAAVPAAPEIAFSFEETATPAKPAQNSLASVAKASAKSSQERPTQSVDKAPDPVQVTAAAVAQDVSSLSTAVLESQEPSLASGARGYLSDRSPSEQRRPAVEAPLVAYSPGDEPTEMDLTDDEPIAYEPVEKEAPQHPSKSVIKTAEAPQSSPKPASKVETKLKAQEAQLLAQQGQPRYTLQLLAASNEDNIKQFINRHGIQDKTRYFKTKRAGKDWFVVVYGNYDSKQEANAAASRFATSFKSTNLQPWVRQLSAVQAEVSKSQG